MKNDNRLDHVLKNNLCLGCAACTQTEFGTKLKLSFPKPGFIRPVSIIPLTEIEDGQFGNICPGYKVKHEVKNSFWTELWGPVMSSHAVWATDSATRHKASSGGGISASLCYLLDKGLIDAVLHIGVSKDNPILNTYKISTCPKEVVDNSGSRYAPAAPLTGLNFAADKYERIAIVGKPCDIVAARNLCNHSKQLQSKVKYFISFMCAGLPSLEGTKAVINKLGVEEQNLKSFRYRGNGWPGYATATDNQNNKFEMSYNDSWGKILNKHLQLRCKVCIDGTGEFADITFADAWYGDNDGYPSFEEKEGRSLALIRTQTGQDLFLGATKAGYLDSIDMPISDLESIQPYQAVRKKLMLSRITAMRLFGLKPPKYDLENMYKLSKTVSLKQNLVSFLGMCRRCIALKRK